MGIDDKNRWKDSVQNGDEIRLWMVDGIAHNFRPHSPSSMPSPSTSAGFLSLRRYSTGTTRMNVIFATRDLWRAWAWSTRSRQRRTMAGPTLHRAWRIPSLGFYQALVEARIPFEMVHDGLLDAEHLGQFRTLILPNIAALSTAQCEQISAFVRNGGGIVATHETSLYDEGGEIRGDFGLAELFGASFAGKVEGPMLNSYLDVRRIRRQAPIIRCWRDWKTRDGSSTARTGFTCRRATMPCTRRWRWCRLIPTCPWRKCFRERQTRTIPGCLFAKWAAAAWSIFPWDIDRTFWDVLDVDHFRLLRNATLWATNEPAPLEVEGKGILDVSIWSQKDSITAHLVNLTNPMMMKGPVREVIPISRQAVRIRPPRDGRRVTKARLLVAGGEIPFREDAGAIVLEVPTIELHELIALDLAN